MVHLQSLVFAALAVLLLSGYCVYMFFDFAHDSSIPEVPGLQETAPRKTINYKYSNSSKNSPFAAKTKCRMSTLCIEVRKTNISRSCTDILATRYNTIHDRFDNGTFQTFTIQMLFDWVLAANIGNSAIFIASDVNVTLYGNVRRPRTIFIETAALPFFSEAILPRLKKPVVLISSVNDFTVPVNLDQRYNSSEIERVFVPVWNKLVDHPMVIHWYAENHAWTHPKVSTLPIGWNPRESHPDDRTDFPKNIKPLKQRLLKVLQIDRVREGAQWKDRRAVHDLCELNRTETCHQVGDDMIDHDAFLRQLVHYPFILCVHGGGLDPSPKAWEALYLGTIPIVEHTALDDAYQLFPVVFVDSIVDFMSWTNHSTVLRLWLEDLAPYYEPNSLLRNQTLERLTTQYWFNRVMSHFSASNHNSTLVDSSDV